MKRSPPARRSGLSLIELMVVLGIITILIGLFLPAVQSVRESARQAVCRNNLRQSTLSLHGFEVARGGFPPFTYGVFSKTSPNFAHRYSVQVMLLPYSEATAIANSLNLLLRSDLPAPEAYGNTTAGQAVIATFLCPSDPLGAGPSGGLTSYRASVGTCASCRTSSWDGCYWENIGSLAEFRDGLANTLAFAEKPIGTAEKDGPFSTYRDWFNPPLLFQDADGWVSICAGLGVGGPNNSLDSSPRSGRSWVRSGATSTAFTTTVPPGSRVPDCGDLVGDGSGNFAARSYHPGGVNAAMADGSVRWFQSGIALPIWRALGTRAGSEVVAE